MRVVPDITVIRSLACLVLLLISADVAHTQTGPRDEYEVKAVYLYHFSRYVQWPQGEDSKTFTIGVLGENPFGDYLIPLIGKKVDTKTVSVLSFSSIEEYRPCQILFVAGKEVASKSLLAQMMQQIAGDPVLVVAEVPGAAEMGAALNFVFNGSTVRFEINRESARAAHLKINAKLLRLASRVVSKRLGNK